MVVMYKSDKSEMCVAYLEELWGESLSDGRLILWGHKSKIEVKDGRLFHKIAQLNSLSEIRSSHGLLECTVSIPFSSDTIWTVVLDREQVNDFQEKFGGSYQIV